MAPIRPTSWGRYVAPRRGEGLFAPAAGGHTVMDFTYKYVGCVNGTQRQIVVWSAFRPRSLSSSSTSRNESEYRRYQRTAQRISSGSVCRHLKIAGRIVFFMISSGYKALLAKVATQPSFQPPAFVELPIRQNITAFGALPSDDPSLLQPGVNGLTGLETRAGGKFLGS